MEYKKIYNLDKMCKLLLSKEHPLHRFCLEVNKLEYASKPDYEKLRDII